VVNPDWGMKRTCHACGAKYYDLKKKNIECPSCGAALDPEALLKSRRRAVPEEKAKIPERIEEIEVDTEEEVEADAGDEVLEDTEDLADDTVEEVVEKEQDEDQS